MHSIFCPFSCSVFLYEHFVCMSFLTLSAVNKGGKQARKRIKIFFFYIDIVVLCTWLLVVIQFYVSPSLCMSCNFVYVYIYIYICVSVRAESKTQYKRVIVVVAVGWSRRVIERRWNGEMNCVRHRLSL